MCVYVRRGGTCVCVCEEGGICGCVYVDTWVCVRASSG